MIYKEKIQTRWHDTDAYRTVRPTSLLVYMQEASNHHMEKYGMSLDELRDKKHLAFILSKARMVIYRPLYAFENIEVQTWTCPEHGLSVPRCYRILRGDDIIAEADTTWALSDLDSKRLIRGSDCDAYSFENENMLSLDMPLRFKLPHGVETEYIGTRRIVYSDLDYNMHMNNTKYPDMLCDFLPSNDIGRIRSILLSYINEAAFGDELKILRAYADGAYYFRTVSAVTGKTCLEAQITLQKREL